MTVVCPKCGFEQEGGSECLRCGVIFDGYRPTKTEPSRGNDPPETSGRDRRRPVSEEDSPVGPGPLMRFYRVFRWVVLAGALLVFVLILRKAPPPRIEMDPQAQERMEFKIRQLRQANQFGQPHTLRLDEAELNSWLNSHLARGGQGERTSTQQAPSGSPTPSSQEPALEEVQSNVRDVKIDLVGDQVRGYIVFDFHGKDLSLILEGRLRVENGYLRLDPTAVKLGSLPVPQATVSRAVERLFNSPENREKFRLPPEIRDIRIENGKLVVSYH